MPLDIRQPVEVRASMFMETWPSVGAEVTLDPSVGLELGEHGGVVGPLD